MSQTAAAPAEPKADKKVRLVVIYNGVSRPFEVAENAKIQSLLSRAMAEFGIAGQPDHALFTAQNVELPADQSIKDVGLIDQQQLVLRSRVVRAGA